MMKKVSVALVTMLLAFSASASVLMSADWAEEMCDAWNDEEKLTVGLDKWMTNDLGRDYKAMLMQRLDCDSEPVQLTIVRGDDGMVYCDEGGVATVTIDPSADYLMQAKTVNWEKMGTGSPGPAMAMLTGKLKFKGPKGEAMANMGPFAAFLKLVGSFDYDASSCPR
jgi:putative sterol carrier protein